MTDTKTTETETQGIDYSKFGVFEATFRTIIPQAEEIATEHDDLVSALSVKEGEISEDVLENARIRNKSGNAKVKSLNEMIKKAEAKLAELKASAYELVEDDVPQPLSEEDAAKTKARVKDLRELFKSKLEAIQTVAGSVGVSLEGIPLPSITTNGRKSGGTGRTGHSGPRIRMDSVYINGNLSEMSKPNDKSQKTSNLTSAALDISKIVKTRVGAVDLQKAFFKAAGVEPDENGAIDSSKLPHELEFPFVHTSADGTKTEFALKVVRSS